MPRIARLVIPEIPHHITQRGNYQQNIFFGDRDRIKYLSLVAENMKRQQVKILAYCLMSNHVHFVRRLGKRGHLWQDRYYSCPLDKDHLYEVIRYMENNPIRAGIVKSAEKYRWSSAKAHIDNDIDKDDILTDYSEYLHEIRNWKEYLCEDSSQNKILTILKCTLNGRPAGNKQFIKELESKTERNLRIKPMGRPRREN